MLQSETVKKYDKYKDSGIEWIGEIPQEWNTITLKRVFSNRDGGAWGEEAQNNENDRICIRIADFDYPKMTIKHDIDYTVRNYTTDVIEKLALQKNDILIEKSGGGDQTPVGRTIIFNEDFNALYANFMDRLRVKQSISPKFIQYLLVSFYQNGITYQYIKQTTGIQNLDLTNLLAKENIVLPILDVQQQIADYLDKKCGEIDRVIETEKAVIEKLKEYKQSIITEAVTKGLDKSVPLKDSGIEWIGKIPQHWDLMPLKFALNQRFEKNDPVQTEERLSLSIGLGVTLYSEKTTNLDRYKDDCSQYKLAYPDDLVINSMNVIVGAVGISKYFGCVSPAYYVLYSSDENKFKTEFFDYLFKTSTIRKFLFSIGKGIMAIERGNDRVNTCRLKVSAYDLGRLNFPIPSKQEQEEICNYLDKKCSEIDKAITDKEQVIEKFTEYKKSLIYECVTGKRKVV